MTGNRSDNVLFYEEKEKYAKRPMIIAERIIIDDETEFKIITLNNIKHLRRLLLTLDDGLEYKKGGIYTTTLIEEGQLITYYGGNKSEKKEPDSRIFLDNYNILINKSLNNKNIVGVAGLVRDKATSKKKEANVELFVIDSDFNQLNISKFKFIDSKTIDDIKNSKYKPGRRIEDRLIVIRALSKIERDTELIIESNSIDDWNKKIQNHDNNIKNTMSKNHYQKGLREFLEIEYFNINKIKLSGMQMILSDLRNIKDILYTIGHELIYKTSSIPNAGGGIYTSVPIENNQIITYYYGKIISMPQYEDYELDVSVKKKNVKNVNELKKIKKILDDHKTHNRAVVYKRFYVLGDLEDNKKLFKQLDTRDPSNLKNLGGGAFINDPRDRSKYNCEFLEIRSDVYNLNLTSAIEPKQYGIEFYSYIDLEYIDDIINKRYDKFNTKSQSFTIENMGVRKTFTTNHDLRPYDVIITIQATRNLKKNEELFIYYGSFDWSFLNDVREEYSIIEYGGEGEYDTDIDDELDSEDADKMEIDDDKVMANLEKEAKEALKVKLDEDEREKLKVIADYLKNIESEENIESSSSSSKKKQSSKKKKK